MYEFELNLFDIYSTFLYYNKYIALLFFIMLKRIQIEQIKTELFKDKAVILYGARQVGKTFLCKQILEYYEAKNLKTKYFNCELSETQEILNTTSLAELSALVGIYDLVVFDEAQKIPNIGEILKILVDNLPKTQVIATGSSSFELANYTGEPLVGRSRKFLIYPISALEISQTYDLNYFRENLYSLIQYGMLPKVLMLENIDQKLAELEQITEGYLYRDLLKLEEVRKPILLEKLVKILAHQVGSEVSNNNIASTLQISSITVEKYLDLLQKSFIIHKLPPFSTNLQSEIKNKPKYYFYDTGILNILLEKYNLEDNQKHLGKIWENFVVVEKLKKNQFLQNRNKLYFWRNKSGSEVDLVEKDQVDKLSTFEIKINSAKTPKLPPSFVEKYKPITFETITPATAWKFLV
jgi:uncharacterized protein